MKLSELIGKQLLTASGESLGYVKGAYTNSAYTKLQCLSCIDEEEEEYFIPARAIQSVGDVVVVKKLCQTAASGKPCPVGLPAYSHLGESLGTVSDMILDETPCFELSLHSTLKQCPVTLTFLADVLIVYPDENTKLATVRKRRRKPSEQNNAPVVDLPNETTQNSDPVISFMGSSEEEPQNSQPVCDRIEKSDAVVSSSKLKINTQVALLGRVVKKTVYDENGTPIVAFGERITPYIIRLARQHNRLLQLAVNTLTNG